LGVPKDVVHKKRQCTCGLGSHYTNASHERAVHGSLDEIESKGDTVLLIKSDIDGTDKLITDVELRKAIRRISNK